MTARLFVRSPMDKWKAASIAALTIGFIAGMAVATRVNDGLDSLLIPECGAWYMPPYCVRAILVNDMVSLAALLPCLALGTWAASLTFSVHHARSVRIEVAPRKAQAARIRAIRRWGNASLVAAVVLVLAFAILVQLRSSGAY